MIIMLVIAKLSVSRLSSIDPNPVAISSSQIPLRQQNLLGLSDPRLSIRLKSRVTGHKTLLNKHKGKSSLSYSEEVINCLLLPREKGIDHPTR